MASFEHVSSSSSAINALSYDADTQVLVVEFTDGTNHDYYPVPDSVANELLNAGSQGAYFNYNIRNQYG